MGKRAKAKVGNRTNRTAIFKLTLMGEANEQTHPQTEDCQTSRIHLERHHISRPEVSLWHSQDACMDGWKEVLRINNIPIEGKIGSYKGF